MGWALSFSSEIIFVSLQENIELKYILENHLKYKDGLGAIGLVRTDWRLNLTYEDKLS